MNITLPTIHLNGTSAQNLTDDLCAAMHSISEAIDSLSKAGPNARDYYPSGPDAFTNAQNEHCRRLEKLSEIHRELETMAIHCSDFIK